MQIAREFAKKHGITLVLKGSGTVVAAHYGKISMNLQEMPAWQKAEAVMCLQA